MAVVGAYARIDPEERDSVQRLLNDLPGVETFDLGDKNKVGLMIESANIDSAHETLTSRVSNTKGVQGVWPVFVHNENESNEES